MSVELNNLTDERIEKELEQLLKRAPFLRKIPSSASKFAVRQKFINLLIKDGIELSKEEAYIIHTGDNKDSEYIQRINKFMINKGYSPSNDSYDKA